ncbi:hypothetical protein ABPG77_010012 [Micractinium sp. CCAP 211/92]
MVKSLQAQLALVALAAALVGASMMVKLFAPRLGHTLAVLMWAATSLMCLLSIPEHIETDAAKLQAAKAAPGGSRIWLAADLTRYPILRSAAKTLAADAAAILATLSLLQ